MEQQKARIIVWQEYAIAALFSPIFVEAKLRLKQLLGSRTVYADGMRMPELAAIYRATQNANGFFENDLSKQDRQTDGPLLEAEFVVYDMLGVSSNVLSTWKNMHENWRYKASKNWGQGNEMRLTGQATTALGNAIVNLLVHAELVIDNKHSIQLISILGDDNLMICSEEINADRVLKEFAIKHNMQAKPSYNRYQGNFCSMIAYSYDGRAGLGPDFVRMSDKFQCTSGVHEATAENILMRSQSYICQLGDIPVAKRLSKKLKIKLPLEHWYDYVPVVDATARRYNMDYDEVEQSLGNLANMIERRETHVQTLTMFGSVARRN